MALEFLALKAQDGIVLVQWLQGCPVLVKSHVVVLLESLQGRERSCDNAKQDFLRNSKHAACVCLNWEETQNQYRFR